MKEFDELFSEEEIVIICDTLAEKFSDKFHRRMSKHYGLYCTFLIISAFSLNSTKLFLEFALILFTGLLIITEYVKKQEKRKIIDTIENIVRIKNENPEYSISDIIKYCKKEEI